MSHLALVSPETTQQGDTMDDDALLAYWTAYQTSTGSTERSIKSRLYSIRAMLNRTGKTLLTVNRHDLVCDLGRPGISPSTRSHYRSLMYGLFSWLQDEQFRLDNPAVKLPKVRVPVTEPDPVTTEDIEHVLNSGIYRRTRMWVLLYAYQGFRAAEIAAVHGTESVDWDRRRILSKNGKGGKEVWRPIHPLVWEHLQQWKTPGWLFESPYKPGQHIKAESVSNILSKAFKRAGVRHRPHQLRAWFATELIDAGTPTLVVAAAMRHSNGQTVEKYVRVKDETVEAAMLRLPVVSVPERSGRRAA